MALHLKDFEYTLPDNRIARYPLTDRDSSKLLVYRHGQIRHSVFRDIADFLPSESFLFFNNTKVIPARIHFRKETGADIEIFLMTPVQPSAVIQQVMEAKGKCAWICTIGNLKRWKNDALLVRHEGDLTIEASLQDRATGQVEFKWTPPIAFAEVVEMLGETPLPPYLKRQAEPADKNTYQTIYSKHEGAVAAPTAGLHFTDKVFDTLKQRSIGVDFLTLHVSAGTFQPIKEDDAERHQMHEEQVVINKTNIQNIIRHESIIPVGTTSLRTLESVYWYGVKLLTNPNAPFVIEQDDPLTLSHDVERNAALQAVMEHLEKSGETQFIGETAIYIKPGYRFRVAKGLITNFHQPASTLILLVAALVGDRWKEVYAEALKNDYRFLSYGDSSLLLP